ncbi:MAG TPA: hypothetical protein VGP47_11840 [Parachlamydiaceae bacterium]|nr:hypothetical protein [Parachlamydiaceae bacterium]
MKWILSIKFLGIIAIMFLAAKGEASQVTNAHHVFSSETYDCYVNQLQDFIDLEEKNHPLLASVLQDQVHTEFQNNAIQLLDMVRKGPDEMTSKKKLEFHKYMINQLRLVIKLKDEMEICEDELTQNLAQFVNELCVWMYTTPRILKPMQSFMEDSFETFPVFINQEEWVDQLSTLRDTIESSGKFDGIIKHFPHIYSAHEDGDIPSHLYSILNNTKEIRVIRTPNVNYDFYPHHLSYKLKHDIVPEFITYLKAFAANGKKHLYVNYIERQNSDHPESDTIEEMENNPDINSAISVVSFARNSSFYKQSHSSSEDAEEFKSAFMEELFVDPEKGNYYWPRAIDLEQWKVSVDKILNEVHVNYFSGNKILVKEERQQFIDVAYVKMTEHLIFLLEPDVVNLSCAVSIDRGPVGFTLLYIDLLLAQKEPIGLEDLQKIATLAYGPGAVVHNRAMHKHHHERLTGAAERLQKGKLSTNLKLDLRS